MATATTTAAKPAHPHARAKAAEPGALDYLQRALEDLNRARGHAQRDARSGIDDATERIRDAVEDVRKRVREEADELQTRLDHASDEARLELGRAVIRAQRTPEALTELTREIRLMRAAMKEEAA